MSERPISLVPGQTDQEIANDLKKRAIELYQPLLDLLDEANTKGFNIVVSCGLNAFGKMTIQNFQIMKIFK